MYKLAFCDAKKASIASKKHTGYSEYLPTGALIASFVARKISRQTLSFFSSLYNRRRRKILCGKNFNMFCSSNRLKKNFSSQKTRSNFKQMGYTRRSFLFIEKLGASFTRGLSKLPYRFFFWTRKVFFKLRLLTWRENSNRKHKTQKGHKTYRLNRALNTKGLQKLQWSFCYSSYALLKAISLFWLNRYC